MEVAGTVFHCRMVLAEWAAAEGLIWADVPLGNAPPTGSQDLVVTGMDFGSSTPSAVVRIELWRERRMTRAGTVTHSWMVPGSREVSYPPTTQIEMMRAWHAEAPWSVMYYDPAAKHVADEMRSRDVPWRVQQAKNDVFEGLGLVSNLFAEKRLYVRNSEDTLPLRDEISGYAWHDKTEDKPGKVDDHACDAMRYAAMGVFKRTGRIVF